MKDYARVRSHICAYLGVTAALAVFRCSTGLTQPAAVSTPDGPESSGYARPQHAMVVLDCSGSMSERIDGLRKTDIARDAVKSLLRDLPSNVRIGLMAYGHRRPQDCNDIEVLSLPGRIDRRTFLETVMQLEPLGATPLAASIQKAVDGLQTVNHASSVIVVTDGLESCHHDPQSVAAEIGQAHPDCRIHVIGFDLTDDEGQAVRCFADETGGEFLPARDAASLKNAFELVVEQIAEGPEEAGPDFSSATIQAPAVVTAGSRFDVIWTGPANRGDYLKVVSTDPVATNKRDRGYIRYVKPGPVSMIAGGIPGSYEICYVGPENRVLGRTPITFEAASADVDGPPQVIAGAPVQVTWDGPANPGDQITIASPSDPASQWASHRSLIDQPLNLNAPTDPGTYEYRYVTGRHATVLARASVEVQPAEAVLLAADEVMAGAPLNVRFTGPKHKGDMIAFADASGEVVTSTSKWASSAKTNEVTLIAPLNPGPAEIQYIGRGRKTLTRRVVHITRAEVTLAATSTAMAGSPVLVTWTGPGGKGDHITIVSAIAPDSEKANREYAKGAAVEIIAPETTGDAEIRYISRKNTVIKRVPIELVAAKASLTAEETAQISRPLRIQWSGPGHPRDFLMVVPSGAPDEERGPYQLLRGNDTVSLRMPKEPGEYELRYVTAQNKKVLARRPVRVVPRS